MTVPAIVYKTGHLLQRNSPSILTAFGVSGTISTAYLAAKASYTLGQEGHPMHKLSWRDKLDLTWKMYIPTVISGSLTIACIIGGTRLGLKRTAAAYSLLTVSERAFDQYKEKVVEQLGVKKEQGIRDAIAQENVNQVPPPAIIVGTGNVLCYEAHTGRYFNSDMETLRRSQNEINAKLIREGEATLSDFYYLLGLSNTTGAGYVGWTSDKMLELRFSTVMSEDQRPCISFEYNYVKGLA